MNSGASSPETAVTKSESPPRSPPTFPFVILFTVWLLVVITATLVTLILPESFASTARIKVERDISDIQGLLPEARAMPGYDPYFIQTEFEVIQSELILSNVVHNLNLLVEWGKKYTGGEKLKTLDAMTILKARLDAQPIRNTSLIGITVYSENADEAARIANAVAETYRDYRREQPLRRARASIQTLEAGLEQQNQKLERVQSEFEELRKRSELASLEEGAAKAKQTDIAKAEQSRRYLDKKRELEGLLNLQRILERKLAAEKAEVELPKTTMVEIIDRANPNPRAIRPNKPLNIVLGIVMGGLAGFFLAIVVYVLQRRAFQRSLGIPKPQVPPRFRAILHVTIALIVGVVVGYNCKDPTSLGGLFIIMFALFLGGLASACIELAGSRPVPTAAPAAPETKQSGTTSQQ